MAGTGDSASQCLGDHNRMRCWLCNLSAHRRRCCSRLWRTRKRLLAFGEASLVQSLPLTDPLSMVKSNPTIVLQSYVAAESVSFKLHLSCCVLDLLVSTEKGGMVVCRE